MCEKLTDTSEEIEDFIIAQYREMSPYEKLKRVSELTLSVQQMALARIRKHYGPISEREQQLRLAALWLDREIMLTVFQWDPEKMGY